MLNFPNEEKLFEACLVETTVTDGWSRHIGLAEVRAAADKRRMVTKALRDIVSGSDAVLARGKPAEDTLTLSMDEWEKRWTAWAAARKAAFFGRAALLLLGESEHIGYFTRTLRASHNLVFLTGANDVLQHATGVYLTEAQEVLGNPELAAWWDEQFAGGKLKIGG
jgi:hypothetical protein